MGARDLLVGVGAGVALAVLCGQVVLPKYRLRQRRRHASARGKVFLVGAGPGDPGLLTRRAVELLAMATVVVVDDLVSEATRAIIPRDCEIVYVGKRGGRADSTPQEDIDAVLVARSRAGDVVIRLKGGDPMVFGRVHSEIQALVRGDCPFEVVPGISSALAAPAVVNIPVTHKTQSRSFLVISLHKPEDEALDFGLLAQIETLVVLMATRTLAVITERLIAGGRSAETPVALIHNATLPTQVTVVGTLADIADRTRGRKYSPAIVVIGAVARYANPAAWLAEEDESLGELANVV